MYLYVHGNDPVEKEKLMMQDWKARTPGVKALRIQNKMEPSA